MTESLDASACAAVAERAANEIIQSAVWQGGRCNWTGAMPEEGPGGRTTLSFQALGADLYGGTAGVGLFLAEVAERTGDAGCRRAALGALRHAISRVDDIHPTVRDGLYAGIPGVALALRFAARSLEEPDLAETARTIAIEAARTIPAAESDLMSGVAGGIVGLLALRTHLDDGDDLLDGAVARGDALLARAQRAAAGWSWLSPSFPDAPGLTGYSHGAAGIAVALLELSAATSESRFRDGAVAAFAYERSLYDPQVRNWPDLRHIAGRPAPAGASFATFWCHGAPGGALARLRALELNGEAGLAGETRDALASTQEWVSSAVASGAVNYSLCHGVAGNAEVLLEGHELLPPARSCAYEAATAGIDAYHVRGRRWPSGAHGGATPCLFLGLAGIGRFYLRLADPSLPSLLLIRPVPG
jgi:class II lanthipeptide synthase